MDFCHNPDEKDSGRTIFSLVVCLGRIFSHDGIDCHKRGRSGILATACLCCWDWRHFRIVCALLLLKIFFKVKDLAVRHIIRYLTNTQARCIAFQDEFAILNFNIAEFLEMYVYCI